MATKLEKDLTRETTILIDGKEIMITISSEQKINLKLKGNRKGNVEIPIETLYNQLTGRDSEKQSLKKENKTLSIKTNNKKDKESPMINLNELRSQNAISMLDLNTMCKFVQIIKNTIDAMKDEK